MAKAKSNIQVVVKPDAKNKNLAAVYFKNVPVYFATVHRAKKKWLPPNTPPTGDMEFSITPFINTETREACEDEFLMNKQFFEVGVDKNKKRKIKFDLDTYGDMEGLHGFSITRPLHKKDKETGEILKTAKITVIDTKGEPFTDDIGNGSICTIKCFAYKNADDQLNMQLDVVQVVEHVPYEGGSGVIEDDELGVSYTRAKAGEGGQEEVKPTLDDEFGDDDSIPFDDEDEYN
jgi:hypothetical protein